MKLFIDRSSDLAPLLLGDGGRTLAGGMMIHFVAAIAPWLLLACGGGDAGYSGPTQFHCKRKKLQPKLDRISPLANLKNKFGRNGLFEFAKSFVKLCVISLVLGPIFLAYRWPQLMQTMALEATLGATVMLQMSVGFLAAVVGIGALIGIVDFIWQSFEHLRKNRMSHQELKDEAKQTEGDPYFKQERRERGRAIATNRMLADVPEADVVIVNPEHYAVALSWDRNPGSAPVCVAKGTDHIALRIREIATEAGVPLHRDPPTARALHATTELGEQIAPEHYRAVAAAIRFAETMRRKAGKQR